MTQHFWGRGARQWGDDHKVGRARERRGADAPTKPHSHPDDRPPCPRCGATKSRINKAGIQKTGKWAGLQRWYCFNCRKAFFQPEEKQARVDPTACPDCGSDNIEKEPDGTWVCWRCPWHSK